MARPKPPGRPLEPASNAGPRGMVVPPWPRRSAKVRRRAKADRIRLTGRRQRTLIDRTERLMRNAPIVLACVIAAGLTAAVVDATLAAQQPAVPAQSASPQAAPGQG